ncbi:hypothetical protein QAD02_006729 [Eretmocerus hayati]|uniref:Uncharacterized protein n=1 Tax=Eretmocerus hayati TaxID=131215 RepID=A0ACC2N413_9HYME|nr:hypothetical protein QAD02_006729 [Eretmocerus hayati]
MEERENQSTTTLTYGTRSRVHIDHEMLLGDENGKAQSSKNMFVNMESGLPSTSLSTRVIDGANASTSKECQIRRGSMSVSIIGDRLCIDGFIYTKTGSGGGGKIYWACVRYWKKNSPLRCWGRATTSDPASLSDKFIVYVGPSKSCHNHSPSEMELENARKKSEFECKISDYYLCDTDMMTPKIETAIASNSAYLSRQHHTENSLKSEGTKKSLKISSSVKIEQANGENKGNTAIAKVESITTRMIGSRLYINGYLYMKHTFDRKKAYWNCKKSSKRQGSCPSKAVTSIPSLGEQLLVHKGPNECEHNHPPCSKDVEEAEEQAKIEPNTKPNKLARKRNYNPTSNCRVTIESSLANRKSIQKCETDETVKVSESKSYPLAQLKEKKRMHRMDGEDAENVEENVAISKRKIKRSYKWQAANSATILPEYVNAQTTLDHPSTSQPLKNPLKAQNKAANLSSIVDQSGSTVKLIGRRLIVNGFVFNRNCRTGRTKIAWICKKYKERRQGAPRCPASALTSDPELGEFIVYDKPNLYRHNHPPSLEDVEEIERTASSNQDFSSNVPSHEDFCQEIEIENDTHGEFYPPPIQNLRGQHSFVPEQSIKSISNPLISDQGPVIKRRTKKLLGLADPQVYRSFLVNFSENPKFEMETVMAALDGTHRKEISRLRAYVIILENRGKIERDLAAMRNNPNVEICALGRIEDCDVDDTNVTLSDISNMNAHSSEIIAATVSSDQSMDINASQERSFPSGENNAQVIPFVTSTDVLTLHGHSIVKQEWIVSDDDGTPPNEENQIGNLQQYPVVTEGSVRSLASNTPDSLTLAYCQEKEHDAMAATTSHNIGTNPRHGTQIELSNHEEECQMLHPTVRKYQNGIIHSENESSQTQRPRENSVSPKESHQLLLNPFHGLSAFRSLTASCQHQSTSRHGRLKDKIWGSQVHQERHLKQKRVMQEMAISHKQGARSHDTRKRKYTRQIELDPLEASREQTELSYQDSHEEQFMCERRDGLPTHMKNEPDILDSMEDDEVCLNKRNEDHLVDYHHRAEDRTHRTSFGLCTSARVDWEGSDSISEICPSLLDLARIENEVRNSIKEHQISKTKIECLAKERRLVQDRLEKYQVIKETLSEDLEYTLTKDDEYLRQCESTKEKLMKAEAKYFEFAYERNPALQKSYIKSQLV